MGLFQSSRSIKATDTYLSKNYNKKGILKKNNQFSVQYVDSDLNVCKITNSTELYNLILPCFKSLADIKIAGIVNEFYRNDTNFKYSAQDFNLRQAILFLKKNQNKLNITIIKIKLDDEIIYQANIKDNRHNLDVENEKSEMLMKENRILKRNLNLSNKYMRQARLQSSILLAELVNKTVKLKNINESFKYQFFGGRIPKNKRKENLFYYELRDSEWDNGYTIERNVWVNNIGSLITSKDILENKNFITDEDFEKLNGEEVFDLYEEDIEEDEEIGEEEL